ncbi:GCN5-related N-acetyltransferase [Phlyctema vagabunda]|uniref:GCN5-related N-acetyltransferase n=1 Tax=Phlyctema vagabunda TaxID=108571 RepID=A0ABR4PT69_9HELO
MTITKESTSSYLTVTTPSGQEFYITPMRKSDARRMQETLSIPSNLNELISLPVPYTLSDAEYWISLQMGPEKTSLPLQVLRSSDPHTGPLTGCVSFTEEGELGYYLHPDFRGLGIMKPAVDVLLKWARSEMGMQKFFVRACEENVGSRRVIEALDGFVEDKAAASWVDWPEAKGGGKRKVLVWRSG